MKKFEDLVGRFSGFYELQQIMREFFLSVFFPFQHYYTGQYNWKWPDFSPLQIIFSETSFTFKISTFHSRNLSYEFRLKYRWSDTLLSRVAFLHILDLKLNTY